MSVWICSHRTRVCLRLDGKFPLPTRADDPLCRRDCDNAEDVHSADTLQVRYQPITGAEPRYRPHSPGSNPRSSSVLNEASPVLGMVFVPSGAWEV